MPTKIGSDGPRLLVELFPLKLECLPPLFAYQLDLGSGDANTVGGKLGFRARRIFGGHWAWAGRIVASDQNVDPERLSEFLGQLWKDQPETYHGLRGLRRAENWKFQPQALAEFTSRGLLSDVQGKIASLLRPLQQEIGDAVVTRTYELRPWVVNGNPAVSVSVFSRLLHKVDLRTYATHVREPQDLVGLFVSDKTSTLKGEIIAIAGMLSHHRQRLRAITQRDEMRVLIEKAPDTELVVSVLAGRPPAYDYVAGSLGIILRTKDLSRFKISRQAAQKVLRIPPDKRAELVREITSALKETNLVTQAFNSGSHSSLFLSAADVGFDSRVEIGGKRVVEYSEKTILSELQTHGLYRRHTLGLPMTLRFGWRF